MDYKDWRLELGANIHPDGRTTFRVWAPKCREITLKIINKNIRIPMQKDPDGYFTQSLPNLCAGDRYLYLLDNQKERPDPVSRSLPDGVHRATEIINPNDFRWTDSGWKGVLREDLILYELHIGCFTPEGTFDSAIEKIPTLKNLGITCIEIMPIFQFSGERNWGYDGVSWYAIQSSYGGASGLKRLVNACHMAGIAVCLDVVYNHIGPEGNYLPDFGHYFTNRYKTPWGEAINFDGPDSMPVRNMVLENVLYWLSEYHIDALRLDAIQTIFDLSGLHILQEMETMVEKYCLDTQRNVVLIAESDANDTRYIKNVALGGYGIPAQWSDDFHHSLHVLLTKEQIGYYIDFNGFHDLVKALKNSFVFDGKFSRCRKTRHGNKTTEVSPSQFVVFTQNHDQVGNRAMGNRITDMVNFEALKVSALLLILSPYIPLLFMGQEYNETAPFQYFIDHSDNALIEAVRKGRKDEFVIFGWKEIPDPKDLKTFLDSKLTPDLPKKPANQQMLELYSDLIRIRKSPNYRIPATWNDYHIYSDFDNLWIAIEYQSLGMMISFAEHKQKIALPFTKRVNKILLDTEDSRYRGEFPCQIEGNKVQQSGYSGFVVLFQP